MIHLQEFSPEDDQEKLDFLEEADLEARGFNIVGAFEKASTVEQMRAKIKELKDSADHNPYERRFYWVLEDNHPIGVITLRPALNEFWLHNAGHIGIAIDKPFRGHGYGTEAFKRMCEIASNEYGIKEIITMALPDNTTSRSMIEKSGGEYWDTVVASDSEKLARYRIKTKT
ncbi:GNAT family N-acetyltransferase [Candidatus Saccharibacteria bacterium]|nr:GNAT family N-acetyltransferase [Candidatus Saccharibacteria bacterium]